MTITPTKLTSIAGLALPIGVALAALGYSLWSRQREVSATIRRGDIAGHRADRAWRSARSSGSPELTDALMKGCGWVINLAIAERAIRRPGHRSASGHAQVAFS